MINRAYLGEATTNGAGLLVSEVEGEELLVLVVFPEVLASLLVHDGQYPGDRLADGVAINRSVNKNLPKQPAGVRTSWSTSRRSHQRSFGLGESEAHASGPQVA